MRRWIMAIALSAGLAAPAAATEIGDQLSQRLYDGTLGEIGQRALDSCYEYNTDACFARGMLDLVGAYEDLARAMYRHGAVQPTSPAMAMLFGISTTGTTAAPANPAPEKLSYAELRAILDAFTSRLTDAAKYFEMAAIGTDFVIPIDPLKVRMDLDGDGTAGQGETLAMLLGSLDGFAEIAPPDAPPSGKTKGSPNAPDTSIGFDNADGLWFAGYANVVAAPVDLLLAHDFSEFFDAYGHRIFPKAGLPMQDYSSGGTLFMDADSDAFIADLIAGIHTVDFPVIEPERLAGVLGRLKSVTALSRRNWAMILAETDDERELVPSPSQTSILPGMGVTQDMVSAWLATLDTVDEVLDGKLLVPHWRFEQGIDLKAWFTTAKQTDLVLLISGSAALPYLKPGQIVDAQSFAEANRAFGTDWLNYVFWFN